MRELAQVALAYSHSSAQQTQCTCVAANATGPSLSTKFVSLALQTLSRLARAFVAQGEPSGFAAVAAVT